MNHELSLKPRSVQALGFVGWLLLCFAAAAAGAIASADAGAFYGQLARPSWAPPGWIFGPVWAVLYFSMALAAWLVWRDARNARAWQLALGLFLAQLAANALWSWLFFAWHQGGSAFADIVLLWVLIVCTTVQFWRLKPLAGLLLIPYLAWVTFAAVLNWTVWQANHGALG